MSKFKFGIDNENALLAEELKAKINEENIKIIKTRGFLGNAEITIAIIAATPVIITQVASVIKTYIERNKLKTFLFKIGDEEVSFSGYTIEEIENCFKKILKAN